MNRLAAKVGIRTRSSKTAVVSAQPQLGRGRTAGVLPAPELPLPFFVGGAPALDFLNSIASPVDMPVEWFNSGDGFLNWLSQANLVKADVLQPNAQGGRPWGA